MIFFSLQSLYVTYVYKQSIYYLRLIVFVPGFPKILHWFRGPRTKIPFVRRRSMQKDCG